jgi:hypothetical protein
MAVEEQRDDGWKGAASKVVVVVALYQGAVPLVVRPAFDRDQRFAPALWLPSPWWWIACLAVVVVAAGLVMALHAGDPAPAPDAGTDDRPPQQDRADGWTEGYDALSAVVFLVGLYNGVAPFVSRLVFDGDLFLAFTLRLRAPWWWIASVAVILVTGALLALIDEAKQRRLRD